MDPLLYPQIRALQAIVREYQHPLTNEPDENVQVVMKSLQATEAQLKKTEEELQVGVLCILTA